MYSGKVIKANHNPLEHVVSTLSSRLELEPWRMPLAVSPKEYVLSLVSPLDKFSVFQDMNYSRKTNFMNTGAVFVKN